MIPVVRKLSAIAIAATIAFSVTSCSAPEAESTKPTIVATTNVWANIAEQIAGERFEVVALITEPAQDPHSFEASARDQLAVSESSIFIMNGGGYDEFASVLAKAADVSVINVYELHEDAEGVEHTDDHAHGGSDHIWYDLHVIEFTADYLAEAMGKLQPENSAEFAANAESFLGDIALLEERVGAFGAGLTYFEAHPMAALLFDELAFMNLTPEGFAEAEEAGLEPSVKIMSDATALISQNKINFLAVNRQVTSPSLESLKVLAVESNIAVLTFDELLPVGQNFQEWFGAMLTSLEAAR